MNSKIIYLAVLMAFVAVASSTTTTTEAPADKLDGADDGTDNQMAMSAMSMGKGAMSKGASPGSTDLSADNDGSPGKGMGKGKGKGKKSPLEMSAVQKQSLATGAGVMVLVAGVSFVAVRKYRNSKGYKAIKSFDNDVPDENTPLVV